MPTEIIISFDTEDFTSPRDADGILDLANICDQEGVTAHFEVVGLLAKQLVNWGRQDVIAAMKRHIIGTHTLRHSWHPDSMELAEGEDYEAAYRRVREQEEESVGILKDVFGVDRIWNSVPPGNSEPYVVSRVYADMGILFDLGPTYIGQNYPDVWFAGQRRAPYGYCLESFLEEGFEYKPDEILDELATRHRFALFCHPNKIRSVYFWDALNYFHANDCEWGNWKISEKRSDKDIAIYLRRVRDIIHRIKNDSRFKIVTMPELYAGMKPRKAIVRDDAGMLLEKLNKKFGHIDTPASWCIADIFCAAVQFLRGEKTYMPQNAYGFLYAPEGITSPVSLSRADMEAAAREINITKFLPHKIKVGNKTIGPADFLFASLELLATDAESIIISPREQLGSFDEMPLLKDLNYRDTWVHTPEFHDEWISNRMRWQLWTLRLN